MSLGSTQTLTEMSTRILLGGGGERRPVRKADKLTANCEPIVKIKCWSLDLSQPYEPPLLCRVRNLLPLYSFFIFACLVYVLEVLACKWVCLFGKHSNEMNLTDYSALS
jgi:hypothetical protein